MKSCFKTELLKKALNIYFTKKEWHELLQNSSIQKALHNQWDTINDEPIDEKMKSEIWEQISKKCTKPVSYKIGNWWYSIAASVLVLFGIGLYFINTKTTHEDFNVNVIAKVNQTYVLPDGSKVFMHPKSEISYSKEFVENRKVKLKGDALFDVKKDKIHPFRVYIKNAFIEVKGTSFLVKQSNETSNEIMLFTGKIDFNIESQKRKITLNPMQKILYNAVNADAKVQEMVHLSFEDGRYNFVDIPLNSLIKLINEIYNSNVKLENTLKANVAFNGSIRYDETIQDVLEKISFSLNLSVKHKKNEIIICSQ